MVLARLTVLIVVAFGLLHSEVDGKKKCSCYTFEGGGSATRMVWQQAKSSCKSNNKYLVIMETIQEWEFINQAIRNRTAVPHNEWHIGLIKNRTSGQWTWINSKPLTIDKWQRYKPETNDFYAVIAKETPPGFYGSFDSIRGDILREWICEEETDDCEGVCMHHNIAPTSTPPKLTTSSSTASTYSSDGQKACSCYTIEDGRPNGKKWTEARKACEVNKKYLVVMETLQEWEFINKTIKDLEAFRTDEWHIGLLKNKSTDEWTWINGKPLTIHKWQKDKPETAKFYALIAKEYPSGSYGLFNSIENSVPRGWICEKETDNCQGVCMRHNPAPTITAQPSRMTTTSTTASIKSTSITAGQTYSSDSTHPTSLATIGRKYAQQDEKNDLKIIIVVVCLGAVLFLALIVLAVVLLLRRKKRREKDPERPKMSSSKQTQPQYEQYESVQPAEAARLLGTPNVNGKTNSKEEPPKVECEYAVVNKANRKPKKGDLVYAQLADFDDTNNDAKVEKPAAYEPTVYADVVPSDVYHEASPESSQPTYENVKTTGV